MVKNPNKPETDFRLNSTLMYFFSKWSSKSCTSNNQQNQEEEVWQTYLSFHWTYFFPEFLAEVVFQLYAFQTKLKNVVFLSQSDYSEREDQHKVFQSQLQKTKKKGLIQYPKPNRNYLNIQYDWSQVPIYLVIEDIVTSLRVKCLKFDNWEWKTLYEIMESAANIDESEY